jgi:hypothetical protein
MAMAVISHPFWRSTSCWERIVAERWSRPGASSNGSKMAVEEARTERVFILIYTPHPLLSFLAYFSKDDSHEVGTGNGSVFFLFGLAVGLFIWFRDLRGFIFVVTFLILAGGDYVLLREEDRKGRKRVNQGFLQRLVKALN